MSNPARLPLQDFCYRNITDEELMYFLRKDAKVDDNGDNADNKRTESVDGAQNKSLSPPKESFSIANMPPSIEFGGESCYNNINNSQGNVNNFGLPAEGHTESALAMLDHYFPQAPIVDQQAQPVINHSQPFEGLAFGYNDHMQATEADIFGSNQDQTTFHSTAYHNSTINQQQQSNPNTNFLFTQAMEGAASSAQLYNILDCPGNNNQQPAETTTSYGAPDALPYFTNEQIQQMSLSNVRAMNRDIYLVRNCGPVVQNNPNPAPIYVGDASVFMNRQQQLRQTQHFERLSEQQIAMSQLHPENQHPKPVFSYSCLIAMALKNSESGSLPVNEIYRYMQDKFPYFKSAPEGWKNSVRHNLSLNKAFYKMLKTEGSNSHRKGCLWSLKPEKQHAIEKEINKWLRKHPDAIRASLSNSDEFNQLFQNVDESSDDLLDENMVTLDMNSISNFIQEQENIKNKQLQKQQQELLDYTNMLRAEVNHQNIVANSLGGRVNQQQPQHQFHSQLLQQHPQHQYHSQLLQQHPQQQQQQKYLPLPPLKIADQQINLQALSNVEMIEYLIRCQAASNYSRPATATDGYRDNLISNASTDHNNMQVYGSNIPVSNMIMVPANQLAIPNNMNSGQLQPPSVRSGSITGNPLSSHKFNKYSPPK